MASKKRKKADEDKDASVAKRLKTLDTTMKKELPHVSGYWKERREIESAAKMAIKAIEEKKEADKTALELKTRPRRHKYNDMVEAANLLKVYQDQEMGKNPQRAILLSHDYLWDRTCYGTEFVKTVNETFGGVVWIRGIFPVYQVFNAVDCVFRWDYSWQSEGDEMRGFEGGIHVRRKDIEGFTIIDEHLTDMIELVCEGRLEGDGPLQKLLHRVESEDEWENNTTDSNDSWMHVDLLLLTTAKHSKKVKFELPKFDTCIGGLKWGVDHSWDRT